MNELAFTTLPTETERASSVGADHADVTDATTFADVYAIHRDAVFMYLRTRTLDEDEALDLTAMTFERALDAIARYRPSGGGMKAWLLRIARNAAIDHNRKVRRLVRGSTPETAHPMTASAEDVAIAVDERRQIRRLVAELNAPERDAIALRYAAGMTAREIGEVIGRSEEATQKMLSRALARLKEAYTNER
jgi:RNA polymerase sigma-70 factor (ECF subfamily)